MEERKTTNNFNKIDELAITKLSDTCWKKFVKVVVDLFIRFFTVGNPFIFSQLFFVFLFLGFHFHFASSLASSSPAVLFIFPPCTLASLCKKSFRLGGKYKVDIPPYSPRRFYALLLLSLFAKWHEKETARKAREEKLELWPVIRKLVSWDFSHLFGIPPYHKCAQECKAFKALKEFKDDLMHLINLKQQNVELSQLKNISYWISITTHIR